eukprot:3484288-Rhodomonas_salina.1
MLRMRYAVSGTPYELACYRLAMRCPVQHASQPAALRGRRSGLLSRYAALHDVRYSHSVQSYPSVSPYAMSGTRIACGAVSIPRPLPMPSTIWSPEFLPVPAGQTTPRSGPAAAYDRFIDAHTPLFPETGRIRSHSAAS